MRPSISQHCLPWSSPSPRDAPTARSPSCFVATGPGDQAHSDQLGHRHPVRDRRLAVDGRQADGVRLELPELRARRSTRSRAAARTSTSASSRRRSTSKQTSRLRHGVRQPDTGDNGLLQNTPRVARLHARRTAGSSATSGRDRHGRTTNYTGTLDDDARVHRAARHRRLRLRGAARGDASARSTARTRRTPASCATGAFLAVIILTDEDDCLGARTTSLFDLLDATQVGPGDFRCQPIYAYECDSRDHRRPAPGTYNNCTRRPARTCRTPTFYVDVPGEREGPGRRSSSR